MPIKNNIVYSIKVHNFNGELDNPEWVELYNINLGKVEVRWERIVNSPQFQNVFRKRDRFKYFKLLFYENFIPFYNTEIIVDDHINKSGKKVHKKVHNLFLFHNQGCMFWRKSKSIEHEIEKLNEVIDEINNIFTYINSQK